MLDQKSKVKTSSLVWGDWDTDTVRLDFDNTILEEVLYWAYRTNFWFKLEGFIILESSHRDYTAKDKHKTVFRFRKGNYLVIFNKPVEWSFNVHVMNWTALESGNENLKKYVIMQCIKETSTVRISRKRKKPIPKIIFRYGLQDKQIKKFLETRKLILSFLKKKRRR